MFRKEAEVRRKCDSWTLAATPPSRNGLQQAHGTRRRAFVRPLQKKSRMGMTYHWGGAFRQFVSVNVTAGTSTGRGRGHSGEQALCWKGSFHCVRWAAVVLYSWRRPRVQLIVMSFQSLCDSSTEDVHSVAETLAQIGAMWHYITRIPMDRCRGMELNERIVAQRTVLMLGRAWYW